MPRRLKPQVIYKQKVYYTLRLYSRRNNFISVVSRKKYFYAATALTPNTQDTSYNFFKEIFLYFWNQWHYQTRYIPLIRISTQPVITLK